MNNFQESLKSTMSGLVSAIRSKLAPVALSGNKADIGLGNVDNTSDTQKPVSAPQQKALDELYVQMTSYTLQKISDLINGAPEDLDTLKEISDAIAANRTVMDALDAAIGKKANAAEVDSTVNILKGQIDELNTGLGNLGALYSQSETLENVITGVYSNKAQVVIPAGKYIIFREVYRKGGYGAGEISYRLGTGADNGKNVQSTTLRNSMFQHISYTNVSEETAISTYLIIDTSAESGLSVVISTKAIKIGL